VTWIFCDKISHIKFILLIKKTLYSFAFLGTLFVVHLSFAQEDGPQIKTSVQGGMEYDSNVFKTFNNKNGDMLTRLLLTHKGNYWAAPSFSWGWDYQGGGKKFIHDEAQDQIIQNISVPLRWVPNNKFQIFFEPDFKYQNENNKLDDDLNDVNEDYLSTKSLLKFFIGLPSGFSIQPQGTFTYFHFYPTSTFSYFREEAIVNFEKRFNSYVLGVEYNYLKQQFEDSFREDTIQEISPYFQYLKHPFAALSYTYQFNNSNDPLFSFDNHKISLLTSFLFGKKRNSDDDESIPESRFSLHLIATLQLKNYDSVFAETPEGERFLVTGSEDENFNNLVVKFNYHFHRKWATEAKYTLISNELTSDQEGFSRSLLYAGLRFDF
jgi:hypothetical protein